MRKAVRAHVASPHEPDHRETLRLVAAGRRFVSIADQKTGEVNNEAPVGTTVALLERGTRVMSAIHKRLHYAQKKEFRLLASVFAESLPPMYPYDVHGAPAQIKAQDFDGRVDVVPVSDPNIFSMAQRIALAQNQLQLAQAAPEMHNLHEQNIDEVLPPPPKPQPKDPAIENSELIAGQQAQAFPPQDHEAHLQAHISLVQSPLIRQTPPVLAAIHAHCMQHVALLARERVDAELRELQEARPQQDMQQLQMLAQSGAIDPMIAQQRMQELAQSIEQYTPEQIEARVAQVQQELSIAVMQQLAAPLGDDDPLVGIRQRELDLKEEKQKFDAYMDQQQQALDRDKLQQQATTDAARLELQEEVAEDRNDVNRERIAASLRMANMRNSGG